MLTQYVEIKDIVRKVDLDEVQELIYAKIDNKEIELLFAALTSLDFVTKAPQHRNICSSDALELFHGVMEKYLSA